MDDRIKEVKKNYEEIEIPPEVDLAIEKAIIKGKNHKHNKYLKFIASAAACICIITFSYNFYNKGNIFVRSVKPMTKGAELDMEASKAAALPVVGSYNNLQNLLSEFKNLHGMASGGYLYGAADKSLTMNDSVKGGAADYSKTNQQVQGVDEGDNVKTDGQYIYKISNNELIIVKAYPADKMEIVSETQLAKGMNTGELFINDKYAVVIESSYAGLYNSRLQDDVIYPGAGSTEISIFDISHKEKPVSVRQLEMEGNYITSRMIKSSIYIVTNKNIYMKDYKFQDTPPSYKDSQKGDSAISIGYGDIKYCPQAVAPSYIMIAGVDLKHIKQQANINAFLGSGSNVYVSENNLYISGYGNLNAQNQDIKTSIYKFSLSNSSAEYVNSGEVKGTPLNQFSMDENNGFFRIATTESLGDPNKQMNDVFVFNKDMKLVGSLEGLAAGEKIYSTRFMGDRMYMVTFKLTDPLFVIDLKNPQSPKVLGELKIPGFSDYLEPYDETHLIGFGQDTVDVKEGGTTMARPMGMKVALFDVSDVNNPVQQFQTKIAEGYSNSQVESDHKALLFSKEKNLLAFPVTYYIAPKNSKEAPVYYQGEYVYNIDLVKGFTLKGKISHEDLSDSKQNLDANQKTALVGGNTVNRAIYINDILYTISNSGIKANNINDLKEISKINFKN